MNLMINAIAPSISVPSAALGADVQTHEALVQPWADARGRRAALADGLGVAIIDDRPLISDCFGRGLSAIDPGLEIDYFPDVQTFESATADDADRVRLVLVCLMWSPTRASTFLAEIARLRAARPSTDIILLSDIPDINDILKVIERGVRGYIPTTVSLEVAVKAMHLVAAGGVYIPASVLFWSDRVTKQEAQSTKSDQGTNVFTSRQLSVIEALRRGKANKIIAYELNMCESTVKVHVRNIMKRLKARNRTEVAYILNDMISNKGSSLHS